MICESLNSDFLNVSADSVQVIHALAYQNISVLQFKCILFSHLSR